MTRYCHCEICREIRGETEPRDKKSEEVETRSQGAGDNETREKGVWHRLNMRMEMPGVPVGAPVGNPLPKPKPAEVKGADFNNMVSDFDLALEAVTDVTVFGCFKHGRLGGWRLVSSFPYVYTQKKLRHATRELLDPGGYDEESGLRHLAHEAWNALALLQYALEKERNKEAEQAASEGEEDDAS